LGHYNTGNVYEKLGEPDYAWSSFQALFRPRPELRFAAHFNLGNIYFERGEFDSAFAEYKDALRIKPASRDAKRNLEITVKKIENEEQKRASSASGETRMSSEVQKTLANAQDKEVYIWKPGDSQGGGSFQRTGNLHSDLHNVSPVLRILRAAPG